MNLKLTTEEEIYYMSYGSIDLCNCCNDYYPIYNYNEDKNYLTWDGNNLYCKKCMTVYVTIS